MKKAIALTLALALILAACGDDDTGNSAENQDLIEDLQQQILGDGTGSGDIAFSSAEAGCFAEGLIDTFGGERMVGALDMEFEEFMSTATDQERLTVVDAMFDCVDFGSVMATQFGDAVSEESARCIGDAFADSQVFRTALADSFENPEMDPFEDPALLAELLPSMLECFTAEELIDLGELGG